MLRPLLSLLDLIGRFPHRNVFSAPAAPVRSLSGVELFRLWSPPVESPWFPFAKATLFAAADAKTRVGWTEAASAIEQLPVEPAWPAAGVAVIADLPYAQSAMLGDYFSRKFGYQTVALFNNWPHARGVVRCESVLEAFIGGCDRRREVRASPGAPPFFMIQAERLSGNPQVHDFDNRYFVSEEDLPSAALFRKHGVNSVVYVHHGTVETDDLNSYFCGLRRDGMSLWLAVIDALHETRQFLPVSRKTPLGSFGFRFAAFRRSAAGGFGGLVPPKSSGG